MNKPRFKIPEGCFFSPPTSLDPADANNSFGWVELVEKCGFKVVALVIYCDSAPGTTQAITGPLASGQSVSDDLTRERLGHLDSIKFGHETRLFFYVKHETCEMAMAMIWDRISQAGLAGVSRLAYADTAAKVWRELVKPQ